jgi:hypothetical protein
MTFSRNPWCEICIAVVVLVALLPIVVGWTVLQLVVEWMGRSC